MSSIGTGYDLGVDTFSPDGRLFQVEYATKAANNSGTALGVCCKDGVVVGLEKILLSKMLEKGSNHRCYAVDKQAGIATAGLNSDARQIAQRGRSECWDYRQNWGVPIDGKVLADRLAMFVHVYTCYWFVRPFGCSALLASYAEDGPQLFMIDPAGSCWGYNACSVGKASAIAKTELEKLSTDITCAEAIKAIVRILYQVHDDTKDKLWEAELYWVSDESKKVFEPVPKNLLDAAVEEAKAALAEKDE